MAGKRSRATYEADLQAIQSPYVFYGTPLPPLDSNVRDDGSFVPIWKQEVTDERGRKRLHGAFTGGFSAGYFNTVGSKEGWTPSTFVSSKSNRWKDSGNKSHKVEDIMDDEDKAEAEEARQLSTQSGYTGLGSTEDEVNRRAPLMDLFVASKDTMGFNLLRKMGWKDGQGIGPRVLRDAVLSDRNSTGKPKSEKHLFAPKNSKLVLIVRKTDRKGLGYYREGGLEKASKRSPDRSDDEAPSEIRPKQPASKKSAFGVGVLNDTGSDDEDPFSLGPKISYSKVIGGDKKKKKKSVAQPGSNSNPLLAKRPVFVSGKANKALAGFRKCHDGRLPLEGFILSILKPIMETNKFPPPKIPEGWKSSKSATVPGEQSMDWQSSADIAKSSTLQPSSRGAILGESPLPGKSVFDFIKPEGRARLVDLTQNRSLPPARSESALQTTTVIDPASQIPHLDASIAASALGRGVGGFVPYTDNPAKLARYRAYLSYSAGISPELPTRPPELAKDEWMREMQEFAHAATIFKPMTGSIATRFTPASTSTIFSPSSQPPPSNPDGTTNAPTQQQQPHHKAQDPAEEAAALSMFGPLTRSSTFFYPSRLLCKRFNVPVPAHVHSGNEGASSSSSSSSSNSAARKSLAAPMSQIPHDATSAFASRFQTSGWQTAPGQQPIPIPIPIPVPLPMSTATATATATIAEAEAEAEAEAVRQDTDPSNQAQNASGQMHVDVGSGGAVDPDRNEALERDRPGDDVFRAVFGSDSESEDE